MRISDWSSDVCSSDLEDTALFDSPALVRIPAVRQRQGGAHRALGGSPEHVLGNDLWRSVDGKVDNAVVQRSDAHLVYECTPDYFDPQDSPAAWTGHSLGDPTGSPASPQCQRHGGRHA